MIGSNKIKRRNEMVNLKDNIWIEGFDMSEGDEVVTNDLDGLLYLGKTAEISEEVAKGCVMRMLSVDQDDKVYSKYRRYPKGNVEVQSLGHQYSCKTAVESIQSACDKEYCIIIKK
jgi:hypothetical protein